MAKQQKQHQLQFFFLSSRTQQARQNRVPTPFCVAVHSVRVRVLAKNSNRKPQEFDPEKSFSDSPSLRLMLTVVPISIRSIFARRSRLLVPRPLLVRSQGVVALLHFLLLGWQTHKKNCIQNSYKRTLFLCSSPSFSPQNCAFPNACGSTKFIKRTRLHTILSVCRRFCIKFSQLYGKTVGKLVRDNSGGKISLKMSGKTV